MIKRGKLPTADPAWENRLQAKSGRLALKLCNALKRLLPGADSGTIGDAVAHLDSCWDATQKLDAALATISQLRSARDLEDLGECLLEIEVSQLDYVHWWTEQLRRPIAQLQREVKREMKRQAQGHRTRTKAKTGNA